MKGAYIGFSITFKNPINFEEADKLKKFLLTVEEGVAEILIEPDNLEEPCFQVINLDL
jgi:hypothetical protein